MNLREAISQKLNCVFNRILVPGNDSSYSLDMLLEGIPKLENSNFLEIGCGDNPLFSDAFYHTLFYMGLKKEDILKKMTLSDKENRVKDMNGNRHYEPSWPKEFSDRFVIEDATNLDFGNGQFNIVAAGRLLNNLEFDDDNDEVSQVLGEIHRILTPHGYFVGDIPFCRGKRIREIPRALKSDMGKLKNYTKAIEDAGFEFVIRGLGQNSCIYREPFIRSLYFQAKKI